MFDLTPFVPLSLKGEGEGSLRELLPHILYKTRQTPYTKFGGGFKEEVNKMARALDWNKPEFEIVMNGYGLSIEEVKQKLQRCRPEGKRSRDAIEIIIDGIHRFHTGKENHGILAQMMLDILKEKQHTIKCPKCGKEF